MSAFGLADLNEIDNISFCLFIKKGRDKAEQEIHQVAKEAVEIAAISIMEDFLSVEQARKEVHEKIHAVCAKYIDFGGMDSEANAATNEILDMFLEIE
jgi:hypothetical protein